ncbi:MAG: VCBS repeat-containing protein [bacterium]|nr:VCBS repeat-containing protein [bacterium]
MSARMEWSLALCLSAAVVGVFAYKRDGAQDEIKAAGSPSLADVDASAGKDLTEQFMEAMTTGQPVAPPAAPIEATSTSAGLPTSGHWRGKPALGDLDGDGDLDLVASIRRIDSSTPGKGVYAWINDGDGTWRETLDGLRRDMGYGGAELDDVDGDGNLDIAFSGHDVTPHVFFGDGSGKWPASHGVDVDVIASDVALADFDRDGHLDMAVMGFYPRQGGLTMHKGGGDREFTLGPVLLSKTSFGAQVTACDIERDGVLELVAATNEGARVWSFDEDMQPLDRSAGLPTPEVGGSELCTAVMDLDGDGVDELLVGGMTYSDHVALQLYKLYDDEWAPWGAGLPDDEAIFDVCFATLVEGEARYVVTAGRFGISVNKMTVEGNFERVGRVVDTDGVINLTAGDVDGDGLEEIVYVGFRGVTVLHLDDLGGRDE